MPSIESMTIKLSVKSYTLTACFSAGFTYVLSRLSSLFASFANFLLTEAFSKIKKLNLTTNKIKLELIEWFRGHSIFYRPNLKRSFVGQI